MAEEIVGRLKPGTRLKDTYTIDSYIGAGAFGCVYKARHRFLGMQAVKVFHEKALPENGENEFFNEAFILSKINHPNVVRVFEANVDKVDGENLYYISMELVHGSSIKQILEDSIRLDIETATRVAIDICWGLSAAHEMNPAVVHRDVIPSNVLVTKGESGVGAKVVDFGVSAFVNPLTRVTGAAGVLAYMPLEAFKGYEVPASDIFSVGMVLFQMLTGTVPYKLVGLDATRTVEQARKVIVEAREAGPKKASEYNSKISAKLDWIILKALSPNLNQRFSSGREMAVELEGYLRSAFP